MRQQRRALWLVLFTLTMKLLVPAGFMPVVSDGAIAIELCSGNGPERMVMAMPAHGDHHGDRGHAGDGTTPCGFAGHAPSTMSLADPILVLIAIAFIVASGFLLAETRPPVARSFLRPHLRGPPASL